MSAIPLLLATLLAQTAGAPLIRVGEVALSGAEVAARTTEYLRGQPQQAPEPGALLDGMLDEVLLAVDAQRSGFATSPEGRARTEAERAKVLAREYWEREFVAKARAPEEVVRSLFHENHDVVRLQLLVLSTRPEAETARARLAAGGDFALEAARSLHRSAANKGDTGPIGRRDLDPALARAAFEAPRGELFGPVELKLGFAVGRVLERTVADEKGLAAERPVLEAWARRQFAGQARAHFLEMSRKRRGVTLDVAFLESLGKATTTTEAQADHVIARIDGRPVHYRSLLGELEQWTSAGSHMFGPVLRIRTAELHLDNLLLAAAAIEARLPEQPQVAAALRMAELQALARTHAARIASDAPSRIGDRAVQQRIDRLRKQLTVQVDRPAAISAIRSALSAAAPTAR